MAEKREKVIVRFPPSPTGLLHMGNARTALYNYLFAKKNRGKFVLRIENTDKQRSKKEFEEDIAAGLEWLGLSSQGEVLRQSERTEIYKEKIQELIKAGKAYVSEESEGENREVVRFRNPGGKIKFQDLIRGEVVMDVSDLKDFIIARNVNEPIYHLSVVVDDMATGVTHVMRGEDHISNTPRQILILEALGGERPIYAHIPLILAADKSKLSKRKHGEKVSLKYYINQGYLPGAMINFLAMIGWNPGTEQEIFTLDELVNSFSIEKVQKSGGILNIEKLDWINKEHMKKLPREEIEKNILAQLPEDYRNPKITQIIFERISKWGDTKKLLEGGELDFFFKRPKYPKEKLIYKNYSAGVIANNLKLAIKAIKEITEENFTPENVKSALMLLAEIEGDRGALLHPVRFALSGREKSPNPFTIASIIGKNETISRLEEAI